MKRKIISFAVALCLLVALSALLSSCGGAPGTAWYSGTDMPTAALSANVGDFYFDEDDCEIYKLTDAGWVLLSNIKGDKGDKGDTGAAGAPGAAGAQGAQGTQGAAGAQGAQGDPGAPGAPGGQGPIGPAGPVGVGVEDIEIVYDVDDDGKKIAIFTVKYTDGTEKIITVLMPLEVSGIELLGDGVIAVGEEMNLRIRVHYEDNSTEIVPVTEDMFSEEGDIPDTDEAGEYYCYINYKGAELYTRIYVVDPTDTSVRGVSAVRDNLIIYVSGDAPVVESLDVEFEATLANMTKVSVDASELDFDFSHYQGEGRPFTVGFALKDNPAAYGEMTVLPVENVNNFPYEQARAERKAHETILCPLNGDFAESEATAVTLSIYIDGMCYEREIFITKESLVSTEGGTPFNSDTAGVGEYSVLSDALCGVMFEGLVGVEVYDPAQISFSHFSIGESAFRVGAGSFDDIKILAIYQTGNYNYLQIPVPVNEDSIIEGEIDFDARGFYEATVWYDVNGNEAQDERETATVYVEVYDPEYCNVAGISFWGDAEDAATGEKLEDFLAQQIVGKKLYVQYYEEHEGQLYAEVKIERGWINADAVAVDGDGKITSIGRVYVTVTYSIEGQPASVSTKVYFDVVPNMAEADVVGSYGITGTSVDLNMCPFREFAVYSNGIAVINPGEYSSYAECSVTDSVAVIKYQGDAYAFNLTSEEYGPSRPGYNKATVYAPAGEGAVYTSSVADGFSDLFGVVVFEDYLVLQLSDLAAAGFGVSDKLIFTFKTQLGEGTEYSMMNGNVTITFDHAAKTFVMTQQH